MNGFSINNFEKSHKINMPEMAIGGLSENWLFKELGGSHWKLLCSGLKTDSSDLQDELGNRLYATFVRIRIRSISSLFDLKENESLNIKGSIMRYGNGIYFSEFFLETLTQKYINANLMTSFSIRKYNGNKELVKSQPHTSENHIENCSFMPDFGNEYRLLKKKELDEITIDGHYFKIVDQKLFQTEYSINPYYDLNGVGLLYFAAYPIISDVCEAKYLNNSIPRGDRWEISYSTSSRDIMYYANCDLSDTIVYRLNSYDLLENDILKTSSSLYRKSDEKLMARLFTIKKGKK